MNRCFACTNLFIHYFQMRILLELSHATNVHEVGHSHVDHLTEEITSACAALPVYAWD